MMLVKRFLAVLVVSVLGFYALIQFSYEATESISVPTTPTTTRVVKQTVTERSFTPRLIDGYTLFYQDLFNSHSIDGNEQINQFNLLTTSSLPVQGEDFDYDVIDRNKKLNFTELKSLFALLEMHRVFLVDLDVFKDIKLSNNEFDLSPSLFYSVVSSSKLDKYIGKKYESKDKLRLSFGLRMNLRHVDGLEKVKHSPKYKE